MLSVKIIDLLNAKDEELEKISKDNLLALNLEEMKTIQRYYCNENRNPTDVELETIAQTWSEHCKHKTLTGIIEYQAESEKRIADSKNRLPSSISHLPLKDPMPKNKTYDNLLKQTIMKVTKELNKKWCISVFKDNAGIIEFNEKFGVAFKVETHNHPSAIEPYGGAGTGIGGVIRDILGVGLAAKPIANTDIFCFGDPETKYNELPKGILHPKRIFKGVVSGVRDYGNRMGIPTVNGAIIFDKGYTYNPLVYCGTIGLIPKNKCFKKVKSGDIILAAGGRTGRDGIHGATFSSLSLDKDTPLSPVQIGNAIVEKKLADVILQARDKGLYRALTDCGAGGFSSAIGELGEDCGARVYLERAPLKYSGLEPWEIWLSEAQERMVFAVPPDKIKQIIEIFKAEDVETVILGEFTDTNRLELFYKTKKICDLDMEFLHHGLPRAKNVAIWQSASVSRLPSPISRCSSDLGKVLKRILSSLNVCSKEWVIRQYDHEVQGQTVLNPLQGKHFGPGDATVIWPISSASVILNEVKNLNKIDSSLPLRMTSAVYRGIAISNGINAEFGKIDAYWMAASVIDEALRNVVAVGGDINRTALLDNFCWGNPRKPDQLAGVVRAAQACYDMAKVYGTPFISGKDSLNNDYVDEKGVSRSIPGTLLISSLSIVPDIRKCVTLDFKEPGNSIYILGETKNELLGSQYSLLNGVVRGFSLADSSLPQVEPQKAKKLFVALHQAIKSDLVRACHDCSDGGLGVAVAEMSFSGGLGVEIFLSKVPTYDLRLTTYDEVILFSESNSRFIVEIKPENEEKFEKIMSGTKISKIGQVRSDNNFIVHGKNKKVVIEEKVDQLQESWQKTLKW